MCFMYQTLNVNQKDTTLCKKNRGRYNGVLPIYNAFDLIADCVFEQEELKKKERTYILCMYSRIEVHSSSFNYRLTTPKL